MLLGSHSRCFYAGEMAKARLLGDGAQPLQKRACRLCGPDCPVWGDMIGVHGVELYERLMLKTARPILVSSSKWVDWLREQIDLLRGASIRPSMVFMQRDGRAVINSRVRKYPQQDVCELIGDWMVKIEQTRELYDGFAGPKLVLHYEDLACEPQPALEALCQLLDISFEPAMLEYYHHEHHVLGGNMGTQSLVARGRGIDSPYVQLSPQRADYYAHHPLGIRMDNRWREELDPAHERLFDQLAGHLNADLQRD